ncbi:hypothetical protein FHS57_000659 [Runella defluvii]|uniref:Uncharacterized protein n=1 Tax=Runella defluvii TaxID=370973 RepID=A0A7W5ZG08_9BACT|nr:hypothetical protein [Runella defluvii]MBB3836677.1 hypothetical protein [Runella defluvii]HAK80101.1 hypothetical protein [Runella sp.]HAO48428.1 hypothetical protein [Runella sp.]
MKKIKLEQLDRKLPFETPEGYFDKLPSMVQTRLHEHIDEKETKFTIGWSWRRTAIVGAAASVVGALLWVTYPQKQLSLSEESLSQVSDQEIYNYLKDTQITQQEMGEQTSLNELYSNEDVLLQQLNVDDEALRKAIQEADIEENI